MIGKNVVILETESRTKIYEHWELILSRPTAAERSCHVLVAVTPY